MKISTESWHYRLNLWFKSGDRYRMPRSLCGYFWTTVGSLLIVAGITLIACVIVGFAILEPIKFFGAVGGVAVIFGIATGITALNKYLRERRRPVQLKPDGVVRSYVRALKQRMCPFITYITPEKTKVEAEPTTGKTV